MNELSNAKIFIPSNPLSIAMTAVGGITAVAGAYAPVRRKVMDILNIDTQYENVVAAGMIVGGTLTAVAGVYFLGMNGGIAKVIGGNGDGKEFILMDTKGYGKARTVEKAAHIIPLDILNGKVVMK